MKLPKEICSQLSWTRSTSILIDESRTPLIISSVQQAKMNNVYKTFRDLAAQLFKGVDFEIEEKEKQITLTEVGIDKAVETFGHEQFICSGKCQDGSPSC
jgi:preprotein translocase subunit SecA